MLYGSQRPSCYRDGRADGAPPTRNKPSFTLGSAEGGTRVRPILVPDLIIAARRRPVLAIVGDCLNPNPNPGSASEEPAQFGVLARSNLKAVWNASRTRLECV
jgi:hypothetical protein